MDEPTYQACGLYIWRVYTGKLEKGEMKAMRESSLRFSSDPNTNASGDNIVLNGTAERALQAVKVTCPVTICKWTKIHCKDGTWRKGLVMATLDRNIQLYL